VHSRAAALHAVFPKFESGAVWYCDPPGGELDRRVGVRLTFDDVSHIWSPTPPLNGRGRRPWIGIVVIEGAFASGGPAGLCVRTSALPSVSVFHRLHFGRYMWAPTQFTRDGHGSYTACVVPLSAPDRGNGKAQAQPSWKVSKTGTVELPVFFAWSFTCTRTKGSPRKGPLATSPPVYPLPGDRVGAPLLSQGYEKEHAWRTRRRRELDMSALPSPVPIDAYDAYD
jgi:hypothetical protein